MEADWYIDPLGRYEGRFFDGTRWTHQVSDRGTLAFDPDWPPVARGRSAATSSDATTTSLTSSSVSSSSTTSPTTSSSAMAAGATAAAVGAASGSTSSFAADVRSTTSTSSTDASLPAATPAGDPIVKTSSVAESPTRQVAVVSTDDAKPRLERERSQSTRRTTDVVRPSEPIVRDPLEQKGRGRRWLYVIGALLLLAGLALALLPRLFGGDDNLADTDDAQVEVVQNGDDQNGDDAAGETPADDDAPAPESGDEVAVGPVTIRNGQSTLSELVTWHGEQAQARGITLPADADCWFAKRGDIAEPAAFCGPVGVDDEGRTLYDQLAVVFDDAGPQVVSASVDRDSLIPNVALEQGRELVDRDGEVIVGGPTEPVKRGERVRG